MIIANLLFTKWRGWRGLAAAGLLVAVFVAAAAVIFKLHIDKFEFIPVNGYFATTPDAVVLPYPRKYNFGTDGFWLQTPSTKAVSLNKKTDGFIWGPSREKIAISITSKLTDFFVELPTRPVKNGWPSPGEAIDLPVGLHHFTHLSISFPEGDTKEYRIGNVWVEVLPKEQTDKKLQEEYCMRVLARVGYNPAVAVSFYNCSDKPVVFTGIHLPQDFPYGIDRDHFWVESKKQKNQRQGGQEMAVLLNSPILKQLEPHLQMTKRVLPAGGVDFPEPVTVESGEGVIICFTLAAKTQAAFGTFVAINPVLRTADGRYTGDFYSIFAEGLPQGYAIWDLWQILRTR